MRFHTIIAAVFLVAIGLSEDSGTSDSSVLPAEVPWFDLHIETLRFRLADEEATPFRSPERQVSLSGLQASQARGVVLFLTPGSDPRLQHSNSRTMADKVAEIESQLPREFVPYEDDSLLSAGRPGTRKIRYVLAIQNGDLIENSDDVRVLWNAGVRIFGLVHNSNNQLGGSATDDQGRHRGLTELGGEILQEVLRRGGLVDLAHTSDKTFSEAASLIEEFGRPILVSHAGARTVCGHSRNLTDEQIRVVARTRGVIGIMFWPELLTCGWSKGSVEDVVDHVEHIIGVGGIGVAAIGSDFDGIPSTPVGLGSARDVGKIFREMSARGYSNQAIEALAWANARRVLSLGAN